MTTPVQERQAQHTSAKKLQNKVALVTGGSRGIGAAIALRLAEEGAKVAVVYTNSKSGADDVVAKIDKLGAKAEAFKANVSSPAETQKLVEEVLKSFGKIDILVNNAGVFEAVPVDQIDLDHYQRVFDVNVKGVVATTIAALPAIPEGGRIINISSVAAELNMKGGSVYSATKAALDTLTRIWAQELGVRKITVNGVAPGTTATDMYNQGLDEKTKQVYIARTALGRVGEPEDIAAVVAFLASDDGRWITGQTLRADGGIID
ncbi:MAG: glucose 1-dehydrogenase [Candidatus Obscuribacterales bacterium]|nr:glucose 1-dehydrogenase [Candidatus Obscuribacterales bacterium]